MPKCLACGSFCEARLDDGVSHGWTRSGKRTVMAQGVRREKAKWYAHWAQRFTRFIAGKTKRGSGMEE